VPGVVPSARVHVEILDRVRVPDRLSERLIARAADLFVMARRVMEDDPRRLPDELERLLRRACSPLGTGDDTERHAAV
jgi:hypothetical protein